MVGELKRVVVCPPYDAGWRDAANWREMSYLRKPDADTAQRQHDLLCRQLADAGAELLHLRGAGALSADAVYVHDASFITDQGVVCMSMGKACRSGEPEAHSGYYGTLGVPEIAKVQLPGTAEAGDIIWLDQRTLLVGRGYRTNAAGIGQLREAVRPLGIEVLSAPLPHSAGPGCCLHLMSLISLLDERTALVDLPWLAVETLELLRERGYKLVEIDPSERETLACNVLALGKGRLLTIEENPQTNARLRQAGFEVRTFPASEIGVNGGGGPTCLTRPILRS
jgi:N-dimethylarginine dimethylaminohydrolase